MLVQFNVQRHTQASMNDTENRTSSDVVSRKFSVNTSVTCLSVRQLMFTHYYDNLLVCYSGGHPGAAGEWVRSPRGSRGGFP